MSVDPQELLALPADEKLRLIELLWDNLAETTDPIPLPDWAVEEASRRRQEMIADPSIALSHNEVWRRIEERNG